MSYDLQMLPRARVADFLRRYEEQDPDAAEINPGQPTPEREAWKINVRDALIAAEPRFEQFVFGFDDIARMYGISEAEARIRYRHVELNLPEDDGTGIQVTIYDDTAALTAPFCHEGEAAETVFRQIWRYLEVLERSGNLATHDPQLGRVLDLPEDSLSVLNEYLGVVNQMPAILAQGEAKKPWWKFW